MDWMNPQRSEQLRYAAALILKEMAKNAPAVFNVFVRPFIDVIWAGLRDQKHIVREASKDALMVPPGSPVAPSPSSGLTLSAVLRSVSYNTTATCRCRSCECRSGSSDGSDDRDGNGAVAGGWVHSRVLSGTEGVFIAVSGPRRQPLLQGA